MSGIDERKRHNRPFCLKCRIPRDVIFKYTESETAGWLFCGNYVQKYGVRVLLGQYFRPTEGPTWAECCGCGDYLRGDSLSLALKRFRRSLRERDYLTWEEYKRWHGEH